MQNKNLILLSADHPDFRLRSIGKADIENLRNWKNQNKNSFFLKREITQEQQEKWYGNFVNREQDHMFIVEQQVGSDWKEIGCMGFRKLEEEGCIDGYNIIRARKIEPSSFTMSDAFRTMLAYAASLYADWPLRVKVLSNNPAVEWYKKNHFTTITSENEYVLMELAKESLKNCNWSTATIKTTI